MEPEASAGEGLQYVGFWARGIAFLVDSILLSLITLPIGWFVYGSVDNDFEEHLSGSSNLLISVVLPAVLLLVFWTQRQSTPGKMMLGARIVDANTGGEPDTGQWVLRYLGYYVSLFALGLGYLWIAFDPRKQGWHDKIAGTVVVRSSKSRDNPLGIAR